ncbi:polysaccharide biosynthesis tyrosine autokinase [Formosa sediminum]|uniref:non-specific protein-tyrosine kinase n=1 Tax=Formosa sediminum TaxID=2594004 RepID=A0A516GS16_9FLAO|nr:tyrosine-protein kinase family protein [Formosa sediminum]QDO94306.1 polysaccharide biosynthesis tyrosine autokinase [Formosa sediminum]
MKNEIQDNYTHISDIVHLYLSKWKYYLLSLFACLVIAFIFLRYSTNEYQSKATIKITDEKQLNKFPELAGLQSSGLLSNEGDVISDEIEILKSKTIIEQVIKDLKLNIRFFVQGRIKEKENYIDPPISLTFFKSDSVINAVDTTFFVTIISEDKFNISHDDPKTLTSISDNSVQSDSYNFGDKINTSFGGMILTPNKGAYGSEIGSVIKIAFTPVSKLVESYQSTLLLENEKGSSIIKLSINGTISSKSENFLNTLIDKYNEDVINDKEAVIKVTSDFITNRLDIVSQELEKVDLTAETLKKDNRLTDLSSQSNIFLQSERENENKLITTTNQIQLIDYMEDHLESNSDAGDLLPANVGIEDNGIAQVTKSHNDLVMQRNRLLKNSSEKNPTVINLDNQIKALKQNLEQSLTNLKSSSEITLNSLQRTDSRINAQIYSTPGKERKFRDITRQQNIKESLYLYLLEKREETAITLGMSSPNAKIIDRATSSSIPVSPKIPLVYLAALIFGLAIPTSIIYAKDLLDNKVHTKKDLTNYLSIPFIAEIPKSRTKNVTVKKVDYSPKAEAFRILRTNIDFMLQNIKHRSKTIFVTSTTSKEGKSHTSVNLSLSISHSEKRVLFIETDIRVPKGSRYLEIENGNGLTDYISNEKIKIEDIIVKTKDNPFLDIIPSGTIPPNPAELLLSDRVKDLFETVKDKYDYIVVDTAAVGLVTDTLLFSHFADLFIYVVKADYLDKRNLSIAQTMYDEKRLPNMTVLLNNSDQNKNNGYGYGYGYGKNPNTTKKWWQKLFSKN